MKRKILSLLLIIALAISIAACSSSVTTTTQSQTETTASQAETTATTTTATTTATSAETGETTMPPAEDGPLTPYSESLKILVPGSIGANVFYAEGEDFEENFVTNYYREKLNIDYRAKWLVDSSQAGEKLNLAVATNDLPDIFEVHDKVMLGRLYEAGQIEDLTDYYDNYVSEDLRPILEYQDKMGFWTTTFDSRIYGLPVSNDFANNLPMCYIRKDWLEDLGLSVPETVDDLIAVARAFRDGDPDGNGQNDTIAIAMNQNFGSNGYTLKYIANAMNAFFGIWIPSDDGGLEYGSAQPEMRSALELFQSLYKEGLFDKEFAVKDDGKVAEDIAAGKIGIFPGVFWNPLWPLAGSVENNENADWITLPALKNTEGKRVAQNTIFAYSWVVVRKGFSNPEALYKSMNFWYECFHGEYADMFNDMLSTEKYMPVADNWHGQAKPVFFSHPEKNLQLSANYIEAQLANDPSLLKTGEARNRWALWQAGGSQGWAHNAFLTVSEPVLKDYDAMQFDEFLGIPTATMSQRMANLNKMEYETFAQIIMGAPIETFDSFVADWLSQGGEQITIEVSDWYKSNK